MDNYTFKQIKKPIKFTACEGGYIATDGLRMCKVTFDQRLRLEKLMNNGKKEEAKFIFGVIWSDKDGEDSTVSD